MIEILKDENDNIKAVCEYYIVDIEGHFDKDGEFVWVNEVYINPQYRNSGILQKFFGILINKCPQAKFGYFWRQNKYPDEKFPNRKSIRIYTKQQLLKLIGGK